MGGKQRQRKGAQEIGGNMQSSKDSKSISTELDQIFEIDTWCKGGFVNHYKTLLNAEDILGQYDIKKVFWYYFHRENKIGYNKKPIVVHGLIQLLQFRLHILDGYLYYLGLFDAQEDYNFQHFEEERKEAWDFLQRNIDIIKILLPVYKPLLLSNYFINYVLKKKGHTEYTSDIEYGKELLQKCDALNQKDLTYYTKMQVVAEPRPQSSDITEMEGLICGMSESMRGEIGLNLYPIKWIKSLFDLRKRQTVLRRLKLLDPFFVNCLQVGLLEFKGDDIVIEEENIEEALYFKPGDAEYNQPEMRRATTLLSVYGKKVPADRWLLLSPMNLGPVKLPRNNIHCKWITHLQNNLQDWRHKFIKTRKSTKTTAKKRNPKK